MKKYLIGIDEAGRGPLAGPVSVGVVMIHKKYVKKILKPLFDMGLNDSKQVSEVRRENIFNAVKNILAQYDDLNKDPKINKDFKKAQLIFSYSVISINAKQIDKNGINHSIKIAIKRGLKKLSAHPEKSDLKLDGLLKAPSEFKYQETIIKGDTKEPIIMLASIMAKVTRDRYMKRQAKKYPEYFFEKHKGYGTKLHLVSIKKYGVSVLHRKSYLNCLNLDISDNVNKNVFKNFK